MLNVKNTLLALVLAQAASAGIVGMSIPSTFTVTSTSKIPVTFHCALGIVASNDFSAVVGFEPTAGANSAAIGPVILKNYDLVALGHASEYSDFTINVPLTTGQIGSQYHSGDYTITVGVTTGTTSNNIGSFRLLSGTSQLTI